MWVDMFWLGLPVTEKILRPVIVYLFLIGGLRLAGKRELAQLNPFDLIVLLTLSNTVQNAIIGDDNTVLGGLIGATTLLLINYSVVRFLFRHPKLERVAEGEATRLIHKGKIQDGQLAKEMISQAELQAAARRQGIAHLREVEEAVLEPGGIITFSAREPVPEELRHRELLEQLNKISREVAALRAASASPPGP
ncbi:MAG: DUF421 domain-containing protein [Acidobacteria bacterium]|nr:MAG: DUF421 domain-containing protein [Acidobacteriota bacterium]